MPEMIRNYNMYSFCFNQPVPEYLFEIIDKLQVKPSRWVDNSYDFHMHKCEI